MMVKTDDILKKNKPGKRLLLIIGGGIAAYKCLDLIRRVRERGIAVRVILTQGGAQFVTPLTIGGLSGTKVYEDMFSLTDEAEMGHIRLSREADLVLVAPATADIMAKMAAGLANDLATTALLATDKPVMIAPSMNHHMWQHPATRRNLARLEKDGITVIPPGAGDLACGEEGLGRLAETDVLLAAIDRFFEKQELAASPPCSFLTDKHILITAGPTREAIDPVRYIANRSSGKQGYALARALQTCGARVTLVSGPTDIAPPAGVNHVPVESAQEMLAACEAALPADIALCVAAVADWRVATLSEQKIKKQAGSLPALTLVENPDILKNLAQPSPRRPRLVIGFAAETEQVTTHAAAKRKAKGCDWIVANDVAGGPDKSVMGSDYNQVSLITADGTENWPRATKDDIARRLVQKIEQHFTQDKKKDNQT